MEGVLWFLVYLGAFAAFVAVIRFVIQYLSKREQASEWFQESVSDEYQLEFPDKEWKNYDVLKERIASKHGKELTDTELYAKLSPPEGVILINQLRQVMVKLIAGLAQLQKDRPGVYKLWRGKLVSEKYWETLCLCEDDVKADISETLKTVSAIKPSAGDQFFDECLALWRKQQSDKAAVEAKMRALEEKKLEKQRENQQQQKSESQRIKEEKDRQKALARLIADEEKEEAKNKKKAGKKKK